LARAATHYTSLAKGRDNIKQFTNHKRETSEYTGLWFQTEGVKRSCIIVSMREIYKKVDIKVCKHLTFEAHNTNMNLNISIIGPFKITV